MRTLRFQLLLAAALALFAFAAPANAATYAVEPCRVGLDPLGLGADELGPAFSVENGCATAGTIALHGDNGHRRGNRNDRAEWSIGFPLGRTGSLEEVSLHQVNQSVANWQKSSLTWRVGTNLGTIRLFGANAGGHTPPRSEEEDLLFPLGSDPGAHSFFESVECDSLELRCENTTDVSVGFSAIRVTAVDNELPLISGNFHGTLSLTEPNSGDGKTFEVSAKDLGSGLFSASISIDGKLTAKSSAVGSEKSCTQPPFSSLAPCPSTFTFAFSKIGTTQLSDRPDHELTIQVCDATKTNCALISRGFAVQNAPKPTAAPAIGGTPRVGSSLSATEGTWDEVAGSPASFAFQWFRCEEGKNTPSECEEIPGATQAQFMPTQAEIGKRLLVQVTGSAAKASQSAVSQPTAVIAAPTGAPAVIPISSPPATRIEKRPPKTTQARLAEFRFSAPSGASFECSLDKGTFKPCRSPFKKTLRPGAHSFQVRATSSAGVDPTPARLDWRILKPRH